MQVEIKKGSKIVNLKKKSLKGCGQLAQLIWTKPVSEEQARGGVNTVNFARQGARSQKKSGGHAKERKKEGKRKIKTHCVWYEGLDRHIEKVRKTGGNGRSEYVLGKRTGMDSRAVLRVNELRRRQRSSRRATPIGRKVPSRIVQ